MQDIFEKLKDAVENEQTLRATGRIVGIQEGIVKSRGPQSMLGEICHIELRDGRKIKAEVVALSDGGIVELMPYDYHQGLEIGCKVVGTGKTLEVPVGDALLGRVVNAEGNPLDDLGKIVPDTFYPVLASAPNAFSRPEISRQITTGIRAIDGLLTVGEGQRVGIFAGSGVGKSTLLSMIARNTSADINIIALIGERGRELNDFLHRDLGEAGLKRSVVVCATSDQTPIARLRGSYAATAIAEYFRDKGKSVMLMFDSVTRFAKARREIALAAGEMPASRGYTASVFADLPRLLERAGTSEKGSITAFYTVLVDAGDFDEPISDTVRGTIDGHIILNRNLAQRQHYPAIDVLQSVSRLANRVSSGEHRAARAKILQSMAVYQQNEDIISVGAYQNGANAETDAAIALHPKIEQFLNQDVDDPAPFQDTLSRLFELAAGDVATK